MARSETSRLPHQQNNIYNKTNNSSHLSTNLENSQNVEINNAEFSLKGAARVLQCSRNHPNPSQPLLTP